jgi:hypothetical protein
MFGLNFPAVLILDAVPTLEHKVSFYMGTLILEHALYTGKHFSFSSLAVHV